ncbi:hypothetical protein BDM02DRAFT_3194187 [Thelephora ganbajun]|uniref:Uncharacterized protein n=1 Tax=Thelephora ganbajun TaxID=370292 RepID=A0ACB6YXG6_THEGA|nr:hypothetical protein BDM02DRAFT_3194187 [Thelephora ganbajun]
MTLVAWALSMTASLARMQSLAICSPLWSSLTVRVRSSVPRSKWHQEWIFKTVASGAYPWDYWFNGFLNWV